SDDGQFRMDHIGWVKTSSQSYFDDRPIDSRLAKIEESESCQEIEKRERFICEIKERREMPKDYLFWDHLSIDPNPLTDARNMWRSIKPNGPALRFQTLGNLC